MRRPSRAGPVTSAATQDHDSASPAIAARKCLTAEHPLELGAPLVVRKRLDLRVRWIPGHFLDTEMAFGRARDLRQVGDRDHLRALGEPRQCLGHAMSGDTADTCIDLVEDERLASSDRGEGEGDP